VDGCALLAIPATTVARTLFDMAATEHPHRLRSSWEDAERRGVLDLGAVADLCACATGHNGTGHLRRLLADRTEPGANPGLEREFAWFCEDYRLPHPAMNVPIGPYVVDALWAERMLIVELDSRAYHDNTAAFERDRKRDLDLQLWGYRVLRVTWRRLKDEPAAVAAAIRAMLGLPAEVSPRQRRSRRRSPGAEAPSGGGGPARRRR
jgi:hypothetical protein